ncbi:MAG: sigma-70 family RNA polymerase sigma factor [Acidobacteria bacterium]|nr:sigma-70 family RNA polymerase sigma factor [Acidobacteriota bacterium]
MTRTLNLTDQIHAWQAGDEFAHQHVINALYPILHHIAERKLVHRNITLQPTELLHEAFLKLVALKRIHYTDRNHFLAMAARAMRQVLVDHVRRRMAQKREAHEVSLSELLDTPAQLNDLLTLNRAIEQLGKTKNRLALMAEMHLFAGLTLEEVGSILNVSTRTAKRDWQFVRSWLQRALRPERATIWQSDDSNPANMEAAAFEVP